MVEDGLTATDKAIDNEQDSTFNDVRSVMKSLQAMDIEDQPKTGESSPKQTAKQTSGTHHRYNSADVQRVSQDSCFSELDPSDNPKISQVGTKQSSHLEAVKEAKLTKVDKSMKVDHRRMLTAQNSI